jgi:hypothetical protein
VVILHPTIQNPIFRVGCSSSLYMGLITYFRLNDKFVYMSCITSNLGLSWTNVSVDSVKCVRPDSIIIGCFQLTEDGQEENYLIQVISSKHGEISDVSAKYLSHICRSPFNETLEGQTNNHMLSFWNWIFVCQIVWFLVK